MTHATRASDREPLTRRSTHARCRCDRSPLHNPCVSRGWCQSLIRPGQQSQSSACASHDQRLHIGAASAIRRARLALSTFSQPTAKLRNISKRCRHSLRFAGHAALTRSRSARQVKRSGCGNYAVRPRPRERHFERARIGGAFRRCRRRTKTSSAASCGRRFATE
jgi:hypothetical protein